jgi:hypothetical protein
MDAKQINVIHQRLSRESEKLITPTGMMLSPKFSLLV